VTLAGGLDDISVHGPKRVPRSPHGHDLDANGVQVTLSVWGRPARRWRLLTISETDGRAGVAVALGHRAPRSGGSPPRQEVVTRDPLTTSEDWSDVIVSVAGQPMFLGRLAGHLEHGQPSVT
jgi:hypothetical protein